MFTTLFDRLDSMGAGELRSSGVMSNGKIKSLLDFLDNADHSIPTTQQQVFITLYCHFILGVLQFFHFL